MPTIAIDEELANELKPYEAQLPEILKLGIREWQARGDNGFRGMTDILETLAALPTPNEVLALRPSPAMQERIGYLLDKNRDVGLLPAEEGEWRQYEFVEHLVRLAKARAQIKLNDKSRP